MDSVWQWFFVYADRLPPDVGFSYYNNIHILWLLAVIISTIWVAVFCRRLRPENRRRFGRFFGLVILLMELERLIGYGRMGGLNRYELPLHLCSMALFLSVFHAFYPSDSLGQILYTLCLPGCIAALVFPGWNTYPLWSYVSVHCFVLHGLTVAYIAMQTHCGVIRPRLREIWKPILFLCCIVPPVYWLDMRWDANYLFIREPSMGSPLEWFAHWFGASGWRVAYALLIGLVMLLMDLGWELAHRKTN